MLSGHDRCVLAAPLPPAAPGSAAAGATSAGKLSESVGSNAVRYATATATCPVPLKRKMAKKVMKRDKEAEQGVSEGVRFAELKQQFLLKDKRGVAEIFQLSVEHLM